MAAQLRYRDISFTALYHSAVSFKPVHDEANRARIGVEYTIDVTGYVTGGTNATMIDIRRQLSEPGGELIYNDHGMGETFHINGSSQVRDARWGPHCAVVDFKPLGGNGQSAQVRWVVSFTIPECIDGSVKYQKAIMAINWEWSTEKDGDGYETVRTVGYLEIPLTRQTGNEKAIADCADLYRERLEARTAPLGFKREGQKFTVSQDRRRLDFSWTDVQQPSPLPRNVTRINVRERLTSEGLVANTLWQVAWSGTVHLAAGVDKSEAYSAFLQTVNSRARIKGDLIFTRMEVDEDIYGRETRFLLLGRHMAVSRIEEVLQSYGVWRPILGMTWQAWRDSMYATGAFKSRGTGQLVLSPGEDAIIDLCTAGGRVMTAAPPPTLGGGPGRPPSGKLPPRPAPRDPAETWIDYQSWLRWHSSTNVVRHKPLPPAPVRPPGIPQPGRGGSLRPFDTPGATGGSLQAFPDSAAQGSLKPFPSSRGQSVAPLATGPASMMDAPGAASAADGPGGATFPADVMQQAASPSRTVQLIGYGTRLGHKVPAPRLISIGGVNVSLEEEDIVQSVMGVIGGEEVWMTAWALTYIVPDAISGYIPTTANPMLNVDGGDGLR